MDYLDLGKLRGRLIRAGLGSDDHLGDAAVFAVQRINRGASPALAVWRAVGDVARGRRAITPSDYLSWGSCSDLRGVGSYRLADGSRVRYRELVPGEVKTEESRECEPWLSAAVSELGVCDAV